ncbi:MAG: hypothetical protein ACTSYA_13365 [Candidatus Kariarchaeaceae archaeon]
MTDNNYHGVELSREEVEVLKELEELIGEKIPQVEEVDMYTFGYITKEKRVEG